MRHAARLRGLSPGGMRPRRRVAPPRRPANFWTTPRPVCAETRGPWPNLAAKTPATGPRTMNTFKNLHSYLSEDFHYNDVQRPSNCPKLWPEMSEKKVQRNSAPFWRVSQKQGRLSASKWLSRRLPLRLDSSLQCGPVMTQGGRIATPTRDSFPDRFAVRRAKSEVHHLALQTGNL